MLSLAHEALWGDHPLGREVLGKLDTIGAMDRAAIAGLGFVIGLAALIGGMQLSIVVSVIGFVIMLAATVVAISSWRVVETQSQGRTPDDSAFTDRLDERWRRDEF